MAPYYTLLCYVNNRLLCRQIIDDMGRAAARSDPKINRQLPQAYMRFHQRKKQTL